MQGRVVLSRSYINDEGIKALSTYYVYDVHGNLRYVLPPETDADNAKPSPDVQESLCYYYKYDDLRRMILKRLPGVESVNMIYDNKDRLVLSQDGEQSKSNTWLYSKYDNFNRVIETYRDIL